MTRLSRLKLVNIYQNRRQFLRSFHPRNPPLFFQLFQTLMQEIIGGGERNASSNSEADERNKTREFFNCRSSCIGCKKRCHLQSTGDAKLANFLLIFRRHFFEFVRVFVRKAKLGFVETHFVCQKNEINGNIQPRQRNGRSGSRRDHLNST